MAVALGSRSPGLAHRVLGDVRGHPGRRVRHPRRWHGPEIPAPRERDRAVLRGDRRALRAPLDAQRLRQCRRREDVEVARQLLHHPHRARLGEGPPPRGAALLPHRQSVSRPDQLFFDADRAGRCRARSALYGAARARCTACRRARDAGGAGRGLRRLAGFPRGDGRRLQHA